MVDAKKLKKYGMIGNPKYTDLTPIFETDAAYKIINGGRNTGKSYSVKCAAVLDFFQNGNQLAIVRRWKDDYRNDWISSYFADVDISTLSGGKCTTIRGGRGGKILAGDFDSDGKFIAAYCLGHYFALSTAEHDKSAVFTNVQIKTDINNGNGSIHTVIFEEYVSERGKYIPNEEIELQELISTIFRGETVDRVVYLIGNLVSKINPYFLNWGLTPATRAKAGELLLFKTEDGVIAFYMATAGEHTKRRNPFAVGNARKHITGNTWVTDTYPLIRQIPNYCALTLDAPRYVIYFGGADVMYYCGLYLHEIDGGRYPVVIVRPTNKTVDDVPDKRCIKLSYTSVNPLHGNCMQRLNDGDDMIFDMIGAGKVWYSDNTTGKDFTDLIAALLKK